MISCTRPCYRFNPVQALVYWVSQFAPMAIGFSFVVGAVFELNYPLVTSSCLGIGTGIIANLITARLQKKPWK
jgi:hypothetical protein